MGCNTSVSWYGSCTPTKEQDHREPGVTFQYGMRGNTSWLRQAAKQNNLTNQTSSEEEELQQENRRETEDATRIWTSVWTGTRETVVSAAKSGMEMVSGLRTLKASERTLMASEPNLMASEPIIMASEPILTAAEQSDRYDNKLEEKNEYPEEKKEEPEPILEEKIPRNPRRRVWAQPFVVDKEEDEESDRDLKMATQWLKMKNDAVLGSRRRRKPEHIFDVIIRKRPLGIALTSDPDGTCAYVTSKDGVNSKAVRGEKLPINSKLLKVDDVNMEYDSITSIANAIGISATNLPLVLTFCHPDGLDEDEIPGKTME